MINVKGKLYNPVSENVQRLFTHIQFSPEPVSVWTLSKILKMHRSNIYDTLNLLIKDGLTEEVINQRVRTYRVKKTVKE